jgi:hypothetical protein
MLYFSFANVSKKGKSMSIEISISILVEWFIAQLMGRKFVLIRTAKKAWPHINIETITEVVSIAIIGEAISFQLIGETGNTVSPNIKIACITEVTKTDKGFFLVIQAESDEFSWYFVLQ